MSAPHDPDRVAAARQALDRLLDLIARDVVRRVLADRSQPVRPAGSSSARPDVCRTIGGDHGRTDRS
jgi:hypothetical protein